MFQAWWGETSSFSGSPEVHGLQETSWGAGVGVKGLFTCRATNSAQVVPNQQHLFPHHHLQSGHFYS